MKYISLGNLTFQYLYPFFLSLSCFSQFIVEQKYVGVKNQNTIAYNLRFTFRNISGYHINVIKRNITTNFNVL